MGRIITFYSYKGGTGRSMALANVAWILASNGLRVLVIDWDLEAPGIHRYFLPFLPDPTLGSTDGLIDYFVQASSDAASGVSTGSNSVLEYAASLDYSFPDQGTIDLVSAGRQGLTYAIRVNGFNWPNFYEHQGGHALLMSMKSEIQSEYDYVLIDSRTGVSDTSGICTITMPDTVVACFTLNWQSVQGAAGVVESVRGQKLTSPIRIFPVPMRVEYGEKEILERARAVAREVFAPLIASDLDYNYWGEIEFPYVPFYAYKEILSVFFDAPYTVPSVLSSAENLTRYLTDHRVSRAVPLPAEDQERIRRSYDFR
jgi:cellulose biosynthesis protein BcsQ